MSLSKSEFFALADADVKVKIGAGDNSASFEVELTDGINELQESKDELNANIEATDELNEDAADLIDVGTEATNVVEDGGAISETAAESIGILVKNVSTKYGLKLNDKLGSLAAENFVLPSVAKDSSVVALEGLGDIIGDMFKGIRNAISFIYENIVGLFNKLEKQVMTADRLTKQLDGDLRKVSEVGPFTSSASSDLIKLYNWDSIYINEDDVINAATTQIGYSNSIREFTTNIGSAMFSMLEVIDNIKNEHKTISNIQSKINEIGSKEFGTREDPLLANKVVSFELISSGGFFGLFSRVRPNIMVHEVIPTYKNIELKVTSLSGLTELVNSAVDINEYNRDIISLFKTYLSYVESISKKVGKYQQSRLDLSFLTRDREGINEMINLQQSNIWMTDYFQLVPKLALEVVLGNLQYIKCVSEIVRNSK